MEAGDIAPPLPTLCRPFCLAHPPLLGGCSGGCVAVLLLCPAGVGFLFRFRSSGRVTLSCPRRDLSALS